MFTTSPPSAANTVPRTVVIVVASVPVFGNSASVDLFSTSTTESSFGATVVCSVSFALESSVVATSVVLVSVVGSSD